MSKIKNKISYMFKPKLKVNKLFFGDRVLVLDTRSDYDGFSMVKQTHLLKEDVLYIDGFDYYCFDTGEYLPCLGQGFKIYPGVEAIKDYGIPLKKFVDKDKILVENLTDTINTIINSEEYKNMRKIYKQAYKNRGFDV